MGVVYHAHYLAYFELGRTELMRSLGADYAALERRGFRLAVIEAGLRYLAPAHYDQDCRVLTTIAAVGGASVRFEYRIEDDAGSLLATGHTRLGCVDRGNRPVRLPADARVALQSGSRPGTLPSERP